MRLLVLALMGCRSDQLLVADRVAADLTLTLTSPTYGQFLGVDPVLVAGTVYPRQARLTVEGEPVEVQEDGSFSVELPVEGAYRNVDVEASLDQQLEWARVPVFSGHDPTETWPGGLTGRLLPAGLEKLGEGLGAAIDEMGWADQLGASLPSYESDWIDIVPAGITHSPTVVALSPAEAGVDAVFTLNDVMLNYDIALDWLGWSETMTIGFGQIAIGAVATPWLDEDGVIWLTLGDATVTMDEADFEFGILEGWVVEWIVDNANDWLIEPLGEALLDYVMTEMGELELGGPIAFNTDLMGTEIDLVLSDLFGDSEGLGVELGLGLGEPADTDALAIPVPGTTTATGEDAHLELGLHEGLFHVLVADLLFDFLSQDISLSGSFGEVIGAGIRVLPGGDQVPDDVEGWCLSLDPGTAYVARMREGASPLATVYLPDTLVDVGIMEGSSCESWLVASLAIELNLEVEDGTALGFDLDVAEGKLYEYGAEDADPDEVVLALGSWLGGVMGLLGGTLSIDLADLLGGLGDTGGLLGDVEPAVLGATPLLAEDGTWTEGLYALSLRVWADE